MAMGEAHQADADKKAGNRTAAFVTEPFAFCLYIGFFAGLIWGLIRWLAVALHFTKVPAAFLADPWVRRSELAHVSWQFVGFLLFVVMSMLAALIYYGLLRRYRGPVPGLVFGALWWAVLYAGIGPVIGLVPPLQRIGWDSLITDFCLFVCWGLFIGYSIAFEYHNEMEREPASV